MSQNPLIDVLETNRLLRSPQEAALFEQTLEKLAQNPDPSDLPSLHLILDDACEQPEVMFSLVHFLESFELSAQVPAFIQVMPDLVKRGAAWTAILHDRIMNDAIAREVFATRLRSLNDQEQRDVQRSLNLAAQKQAANQMAILV